MLKFILQFGDQTSNKSLIQLWETSPSTNPKMRAGIAHDFGKVWCLKWLPSGGQMQASSDHHLSRLGLLAAACSDGTVRIFAVPDLPSDGGPKVYRPTRVLTLATSSVAAHRRGVICTDLAWYKGPGHKVVAAAFSSGHVGLWNLATKSPLLKKTPDEILPYLYFRY